MKIGDRVYVHGHVDEIRKDTVIIRNEGGYFGTVKSEIVEARKTEDIVSVIRCKDCKHWNEYYRECNSPNWDTGTDDCFVVPAGFYCGWAERKEG